MVTTMIARRAQVHQIFLSAHTGPGVPNFALALKGLTARLSVLGAGAPQAQGMAYGLLYRQLIGQATTLAYIDTYFLLAIGAGLMFLFSFTLKKNEPGGGAVMEVG